MSVANLAGVLAGPGHPLRLVGVVNVSPESFYAGSVARGDRALARLAERLVAEGADILDLGAMSTAPYKNAHITEDEERDRLTRAVRVVRRAVGVPLSVDTQRARVAAAALDAGAAILNDVSGLAADPAMAEVAGYAAAVILMANETRPGGSGRIAMIRTLLRAALRRAAKVRIPPQAIVLDPGIGFFRQCKLPWHEVDRQILQHLSELTDLRHPLLVGVSRKSFLGHWTGHSNPADRLAASLAATTVAVLHGASLIRTHDVAATRDAVQVAERLKTDPSQPHRPQP